MSYYCYAFKPLLSGITTEKGSLCFNEEDEGFYTLSNYLGDEYLHRDVYGFDFILLEEVSMKQDLMRPYSLNWGVGNKPPYYGDADCFIPALGIESKIKVSDNRDEKLIKSSLSYLKILLQSCDDLILLFPL